MSLLLADDVPSSQESMRAESPADDVPPSPEPQLAGPAPTRAAAPAPSAAPVTPRPSRAATPETPQHAEPEGQDGQEEVDASQEGVKASQKEVKASPNSNLSSSGKKKTKNKASPQVGKSPEVAGVITGKYAALESEEKHLEKAAMLSAKAQEAMKRFRIRQKGPEVTPQKETPKPKAGSVTKEQHPAAKSRAARGTAGTFCGRKPPRDPEAAAEFAAIRDAYHELKADRASTKKGNSPSACEYLNEMREIIADLKKQHPEQPSRWIMAEAHKVRRSRGSGSTSRGQGVQAKDKKATKSKKGKKDDKEKEDKKAKRAKKGQKEEDEEVDDPVWIKLKKELDQELERAPVGEEGQLAAPVGEEGQERQERQEVEEEGEEHEERDERIEGEIPEYEEEEEEEEDEEGPPSSQEATIAETVAWMGSEMPEIAGFEELELE